MRPRKPETTGDADPFRTRLHQIIKLKHARRQDRLGLDRSRDRAALHREGSVGNREPLRHRAISSSTSMACPTKASVSAGSDPYFQHFTGLEFFQHEFPHERSDLSHWRKRLGDKLELLPAEK